MHSTEEGDPANAPVGARLAGESALKDAFAGKPGSYEKRFARLTDRH